jgi:naphthoate synthase
LVEWKRSGPQPGTEYSDILYETADGIAKIALNRPEVRNAFRPATLFELSNAFNSAPDDPGISVIILTGAGEVAQEAATPSRRGEPRTSPSFPAARD